MFSVLTVCTMNICRSPAMELVLRRRLSDPSRFTVSSAGTHAVPGSPSCELSLALVGHTSRTELSRQLMAEVVADVDLILTAERRHRETVRVTLPQAAGRCFTLLEMAGLLRRYTGEPQATSAPEMIDSLNELRNRPSTATSPVRRGRWWSAHPDDIPDPHVVGYSVHRMSSDLIKASAEFIGDQLATTKA